MGVKVNYLWIQPSCVDDRRMNHWVTVTGTARDSSGKLVAFTICDSGRCLNSNSIRTVSVKNLGTSYSNVAYTSVVIFDHAAK